MSTQSMKSQFTDRRGQLIAELFLDEMGPEFISRPVEDDVGYDFLVGFPNKKGGINTFAVEVKATERPPGRRITISTRVRNRLVHSNIPGLLLVADVKQNRLYYAWLTSAHLNGDSGNSVLLNPVDEKSKSELRAKFAESATDLASTN
jgi:hypothetical protein